MVKELYEFKESPFFTVHPGEDVEINIKLKKLEYGNIKHKGDQKDIGVYTRGNIDVPAYIRNKNCKTVKKTLY